MFGLLELLCGVCLQKRVCVCVCLQTNITMLFADINYSEILEYGIGTLPLCLLFFIVL